jgi:DNA-binding HxlR family transcriptional regulator
LQAIAKILSVVPEEPRKQRSGCPVNLALEVFGDRWSLLIVRDLMVRGLRTFGQFRASGEGIATNVLADRLRRLEAAGILAAEAAESDRRQVHYRLTEKGIDLAPVLLELFVWGARHEEAEVPCQWVESMQNRREQVLREVRRRWEERDHTPLLAPPAKSENGMHKERRRAKR